jgi:hypothetical protein
MAQPTDRAQLALDAARDGWGVSLRYWLLRALPGASVLGLVFALLHR